MQICREQMPPACGLRAPFERSRGTLRRLPLGGADAGLSYGYGWGVCSLKSTSNTVFASWVALCAILLLTISGCSQLHRFGNDPPLSYPTNHAVQPAVLPGKYGKEFSGSFLSDPKTFNYWVSDDADSGNITGMLYDTLNAQDSFTLQFKPRLAYLPKITNGGLTYTYTLRPNLKWSDGQPLTADDVIFTFDLLFDPRTTSIITEGIEIPVKQTDGKTKLVPFKYKELDSRTVQFTLPHKWAPAESMFIIPIAPKHALYSAFKAGSINNTWGIDTPPSQLVASGPFVMSEYVPQQRIVYKRNPYFWRKLDNGQQLPFIDRFNYTITPDIDAMVLNFTSGGSDSVSVSPSYYPGLARYAKRDNYTMIDSGMDWGFLYLCFNQNPNSVAMKPDLKLLKVFSDVRFRQACSYAIDRQSLCNSVFLGLAQPLYTPITSADVNYYDPNVQKYPYDPGKARQLLQAMGCKSGADGMLTYEGEPISFNILTNVENPVRKECQVIVANNLRQVGINATYTAINFNDLIRRVNGKPYDWQASLMGFTGGPEPNGDASLWRSDGDQHQWWPNEATPATPWEAQIDRDYNLGAEELDPKKRKKYYDDFQEILGQEQPMIFLVTGEDYDAVRNPYGNVEPTAFYGFGGSVYWNLEEEFSSHASRLTP